MSRHHIRSMVKFAGKKKLQRNRNMLELINDKKGWQAKMYKVNAPYRIERNNKLSMNATQSNRKFIIYLPFLFSQRGKIRGKTNEIAL